MNTLPRRLRHRFSLLVEKSSLIIWEVIIELCLMKQYIARMQGKIRAAEQMVGSYDSVSAQSLEEVCKKTSELIEKQHKDLSRKYERLRRSVDRYGDLIDRLPTQDKLNFVIEEIDDLKVLSEDLIKIEQSLPALNAEIYTELRPKVMKILELASGGKAECKEKQLTVHQPTSCSTISEMRTQARSRIHLLLEANTKMTANINLKLKRLYEKSLGSQ